MPSANVPDPGSPTLALVLTQLRRWIAYPLAWLAAMLIPMAWAYVSDTWGATSAVNQFQIDHFDARYTAVPRADRLRLEVSERIVASFPKPRTNRGIERRLDARYGNTRIQLDDFTVTDGNGEPLRFQKRTADDGDVILRIGDPSKYVSGTVTYVIGYTIGNAMVDAGDHQEIYLDINGTGWLQPFSSVTATVDVSRIADRLLDQQACYRGPAGSTQRCAITRDGTTVRAEAAGLGPRQTMTIAIGFQPGTVATAVPLPRATTFGWPGIAAMPAAGVLALALALGMRAVRRNLGEARNVEVRFAPPRDIPAIVAADFLGRPETGAAAQLAELVVQGRATITAPGEPVATAAQPRRLGRRQTRDLRAGLQVALTGSDQIKNRRLRDICRRLFGSGSRTSLDEVRQTDVTATTIQRRQLLADQGLRKDAVMPGVLLAVGVGALLVWGWLQLARGIPGLAWPFLGCGLAAVLLVVAAVHFYPRVGGLTARGREVRDQLAGLRRFVTMAEADRIAWLQNAVDAPRIAGPDAATSLVQLYEPLLPYAIIFGAEGTWRGLLGSLYQTLPDPPDRERHAGALALASLPADNLPRLYDRRDDRTSSWWDTRPGWGEGWIATGADSLAQSWDSYRASRDDDSGGGGWSSGGSSWSSSSSGGSSGGGSSGGGMGGGGGGGW